MLCLCNTCKYYEATSKFFSVQWLNFAVWWSLNTIYTSFWFLFLCLEVKRVKYLRFAIRLQAELIIYKKTIIKQC